MAMFTITMKEALRKSTGANLGLMFQIQARWPDLPRALIGPGRSIA